MVVLQFPKELIKDSELLSSLDTDIFQEFVKFALNSVTGKVTNSKVFVKASASLGVTPEQVEAAVGSLVAVLVFSSKKNASEEDFSRSVTAISLLNDENYNILISAYKDLSRTLRADLGRLSVKSDRYESLDWRLDVEVATRNIRNDIQAMFLLELTTRDAGNQVHTNLLQADFSTLNHIKEELELALAEGKNAHARRIQKYVK